MMVRKKRLCPKRILFIFLAFFFIVSLLTASEPLVLKVGTLMRGDGIVIKDAIIVIKGRKIEFVGKSYPLNKSTDALDFKCCIATPGFIAANAYLNISKQTKKAEIILRKERTDLRKEVHALNEEESESTPEMNLFNSIDPRSEDLEKAWRGGVTCLYVAPGNLNVFNGTGTVLKTAGNSLEDMLIKNKVHLKVTLGPEPACGNQRGFPAFSLKSRRPQNRMGVIFIFRNELIKLQNKSRIPDSQLSPQEIIFRQVLKREMPLRIRARSYMDIKAALRMMEEFGYRWILEDGVDAYKYLDELRKNKIPVIYGPSYKPKGRNDFNSENDRYFPLTPLRLAEEGVLFAFQNNEASPIGNLRDEAIYAVELGLARKEALKALTLNAAKILGVEDRLGTIEEGKDADILLFKGDPFEPSSRLECVIINGKILNPNG